MSGTVSARGARRRLRALAMIGWSCAQLAARCGMTAGDLATIRDLPTGQGPARIPTWVHERVAGVYQELCMTLPEGLSEAEREEIARERAAARAARWRSPLSWDDIDTDRWPVPNKPAPRRLDPVAVALATDGRIAWAQLLPAERSQAVEELAARGLGADEIAMRLGTDKAAIANKRHEMRTGRSRGRNRVAS